MLVQRDRTESAPTGASPSGGLELRGAVVRYGSVVALDGCSLHLRPGRVLGLRGPHGPGKTTAMRCVFGPVAPERGEVRWDGRPHRRADATAVREHARERGLYTHMRVRASSNTWCACRGWIAAPRPTR